MNEQIFITLQNGYCSIFIKNSSVEKVKIKGEVSTQITDKFSVPDIYDRLLGELNKESLKGCSLGILYCQDMLNYLFEFIDVISRNKKEMCLLKVSSIEAVDIENDREIELLFESLESSSSLYAKKIEQLERSIKESERARTTIKEKNAVEEKILSQNITVLNNLLASYSNFLKRIGEREQDVSQKLLSCLTDQWEKVEISGKEYYVFNAENSPDKPKSTAPSSPVELLETAFAKAHRSIQINGKKTLEHKVLYFDVEEIKKGHSTATPCSKKGKAIDELWCKFREDDGLIECKDNAGAISKYFPVIKTLDHREPIEYLLYGIGSLMKTVSEERKKLDKEIQILEQGKSNLSGISVDVLNAVCSVKKRYDDLTEKLKAIKCSLEDKNEKL